MASGPVLALLFPLLGACETMRPSVEPPRREYVSVPPPPLDSLRAAPQTVRIGNLRLTAGAELWINLMPGPTVVPRYEGPPRTPLAGTICVHPADAANAPALPVGLAIAGAWLRAGDSIWPVPVAPSNATRPGAVRLAQDVAGGPAWLERNPAVDVVLRVRSANGATRLLQVRQVPVRVVE
jgi:hypothetical protein